MTTVGLPNYVELFGRQVRMHRTQQGLTQQEVAEQCGLYRTYLSRIENGIANPSIEVMVALAAALNVKPSLFLLGDSEWPLLETNNTWGQHALQ